MVQAAQVSPNFFEVLPAKPLRGRTFLPEEGQPGHEREAILSRALWQHQFGGDPGIVGRTIELDQQGFTVVGIVGEDAALPQAVELWMPLALTPQQRNDRADHYLHVVGELAPGVSVGQAAAEMRTISARTDAAYPATNRGWGVHLQPLATRIVGSETYSYVYLLLGAVGFLLLLACANVANLQFARALGRNHELAIRTALGAGRGRLLRQLLNENIVLGLGGAVVGTAFAAVSLRLILAYMPADVAVFIGGWDHIRLDTTALLYTLAIAIAAGVVAGMAPAWHASTPDLNASLKEGGRGTIGSSRRRLRAGLVAVQVALALILLVGAGLMVQGFNALLSADSSFEPDATLTAAVNLPGTPQYQQPSARAAFFAQALQRLGALPGVRAAAIADLLPLGNDLNTSSFSIEGQPISDASQQRYAVPQAVSPNFIAMLHIPLLEGRGLMASDGPGAPPVALVSKNLARRYWPGRSALGQRVKLGRDNSTQPWLTIVGVVGDVQWNWGDTDVEYTLYRPAAQNPSASAYFLLRVAGGGDVTTLGPAMRQAVAAVDAKQPLFDLKTLAEVIHESSIGVAYVAVMLSVAAVLALILAAIGVYGVMALLVSERVHEFGIRRALGASPGAIVGLVLRRGGAMLAWGLALGLPVSYMLARGLQGLILGISAGDLGTYAGICSLLAAMAALACYLPARAATRVDPLSALRE
ncbi:MAG: ABC transporter permease, partial [Terriglobales bacterium]